MGIVIPDLVVLNLLEEGERMILSDLDKWLPIIFKGQSEAVIDQLRRFYKLGINAENAEDARDFRVKKTLGFPRQSMELPCWSVTLQPENEELQAFAQVLEDREDELEIGSAMLGTVSVYILSIDPTLTVLLHAVAKFILMFYRERMELEHDMKRQTISGGDFIVPPELHPDIGYGRQLTLTSLYAASWTTAYEKIEKITDYDTGVEGINTGAHWQTAGGVPLED